MTTRHVKASGSSLVVAGLDIWGPAQMAFFELKGSELFWQLHYWKKPIPSWWEVAKRKLAITVDDCKKMPKLQAIVI